jgi:hypothetical protein
MTTQWELLTMATQTLPSSNILDEDDAAPQTAAPAESRQPSLMHRFYDALVETQHRRAQREVDRVLGYGVYRRTVQTPLPPKQ